MLFSFTSGKKSGAPGPCSGCEIKSLPKVLGWPAVLQQGCRTCASCKMRTQVNMRLTYPSTPQLLLRQPSYDQCSCHENDENDSVIIHNQEHANDKTW